MSRVLGDSILGKSDALSGRNLLSIKDLSKSQVEAIIKESELMLEAMKKHAKLSYLQNMILATLFFEPSTRTRLSFESAMQRLGGGVIGFADASTTSSTKGESLADTMEVVSTYADAIVIRHPNIGSAEVAAAHSRVPVINAGDGAGQHPTQALLDLFTIKVEKKKIKGLNVAIIGDLKNARTSKSLAYILAMFGNDLTLIGPKSLQMQKDTADELKEKYAINVKTSESLDAALDSDVIYIPRIQKERFADPEEYKKYAANYYTIDKKFIEKSRHDPIIMSPLPRITEISHEIDGMKNSVYFKQASYGVPVRMAVLKMILYGQK